MRKIFACSDIHGFYTLWMNVLDKNNYNPDSDIICVVGDLLDRGNEPLKCLEFVNNIPNERKILITGNHEDLIQLAINRKYFMQHDYTNGTAQTIINLSMELDDAKIFKNIKHNKELNKYLKSTISYFETDKYIFTHGWIPCVEKSTNYISKDIFIPSDSNKKYEYNPNWRDSSDKTWQDARWYNGMECWNCGVREPNKTIVVGHYHASWGNSKLHHDGVEFPNMYSTNPEHKYANFNSFEDDGIICLDACTAYSKKINLKILEIDDEDFESSYLRFYDRQN